MEGRTKDEFADRGEGLDCRLFNPKTLTLSSLTRTLTLTLGTFSLVGHGLGLSLSTGPCQSGKHEAIDVDIFEM
jgi:hypothetical protein